MEYLKVWTSFREIMEPLTDDEKGRLFMAMLEYAETGVEPALTGNERYVWPTARQGIRKASEENERMKAMGAKGGRPKKADETSGQEEKTAETCKEAEKPTETCENLSKPIETYENPYKDKDKVKDKDNKEIDKEGAKPLKRFTPPTVEEVESYCKERGNSINPQTFVDFYASKGWRVGNNPMRDWKACVRTWEQRDNNRGSPVQKPKLLRAQDYEQRDYDEQEMRKILGVDSLFREDAS